MLASFCALVIKGDTGYLSLILGQVNGAVDNYFTEMCSGSEAGSYLRLIDFVYHSSRGLRVIKKKDYVSPFSCHVESDDLLRSV